MIYPSHSSHSSSHSSGHSSGHSGHSAPSMNEGAPAGRKMRKKVCRFCADHSLIIDYKEPRLLAPFISERGKMTPRRVTGNCAFHQRRLQEAIKRSRILALLPFTSGLQF